MLLGFSFESRHKRRALATTGPVMTIGLSKIGARTRKKIHFTRENKID